jgi:hypothetical protein
MGKKGVELGAYDGKVAADGARGGGERVGCAEDNCVVFCELFGSEEVAWGCLRRSKRTTASLDGITAFPDHGTDGTTQHVCIASARYQLTAPFSE